MKIPIVVKKIRDGLYIASCSKFSGCHIQAKSEKEALLRIKQAIQLMVLSYKQHYEKVPLE